MQSAEIELKIPIVDLHRLQQLLPAAGFKLDTPRTFEQNTLYDTPQRSLRGPRQILRIRNYGGLWTVTHKRPVTASLDAGEVVAPESRYKVRIETETVVDDGPAMGAIFEQLGYTPVFRYEKFRTEWSQVTSTIDGPLFEKDAGLPAPRLRSHLVVDETPIGDFAELEGPPAWIDATLERLGIDPGACITESYGRLFLAWKQRTGSTAENLTFEEIQAAETVQA
ncbi:MAG TPA: class IV adenylate cyclase [Acidobacteriaceae bacterium]|nr:class IV adenylate cyclase [Acidobacteriaceae bacterium]